MLKALSQLHLGTHCTLTTDLRVDRQSVFPVLLV